MGPSQGLPTALAFCCCSPHTHAAHCVPLHQLHKICYNSPPVSPAAPSPYEIKRDYVAGRLAQPYKRLRLVVPVVGTRALLENNSAPISVFVNTKNAGLLSLEVWLLDILP